MNSQVAIKPNQGSATFVLMGYTFVSLQLTWAGRGSGVGGEDNR